MQSLVENDIFGALEWILQKSRQWPILCCIAIAMIERFLLHFKKFGLRASGGAFDINVCLSACFFFQDSI